MVTGGDQQRQERQEQQSWGWGRGRWGFRVRLVSMATLLCATSSHSFAFALQVAQPPCASLGLKRSQAMSMSSSLQPTPGGDSAPYTVVFLRHGQVSPPSTVRPPVSSFRPSRGRRYPLRVLFPSQSTWNQQVRFIGWSNSELTEQGELEARVAGQVLLSQGYSLDTVFTSFLKRSIKTAWVVLDELDQHHVPIVQDWRLNERCYGALTGKNKKNCVREYGEQQVRQWRRSYDIRPPPLERDSQFWSGNDAKYNFLPRESIPLSESLKDVQARSTLCWEENIVPTMRQGKLCMVVGHENGLRSLLMHIDGISEEDIVHVELPRAVPLLYQFDADMQPIQQPNAEKYLSGRFVGDVEEIKIIQERDLKNVYDLSVKENLEESPDRHYAAKLGDILQPCEVSYDDVIPATERGCRDSNPPLLLYGGGLAGGERKS
jgi:2,3-bisphosphoglycerate-dependent phosphoglycerate mutase